MAYLPNAEAAVIDIRKLRDYCLNSEHDEGQHKAVLFAKLLGMTQGDAETLRSAILQAIQTHEAIPKRADAFGQRYAIDFDLEHRGRRARVRTGWIVEHGVGIPRLTTCYPK